MFVLEIFFTTQIVDLDQSVLRFESVVVRTMHQLNKLCSRVSVSSFKPNGWETRRNDPVGDYSHVQSKLVRIKPLFLQRNTLLARFENTAHAPSAAPVRAHFLLRIFMRGIFNPSV